MAQITEVRWHARAGQGAVTAAKTLAESALNVGLHSQAFPDYGPERSGAPLRAYNRISDQPLRMHCGVTSPDVVLVLDPTLVGVVNVADGAKENTVVIINTPETPAKMRAKIKLKGGKVYTVDATKIALETIGRPIPNTPMMGALIKATGLLKIDDVKRDIETALGKKFSQKVIDGNLAAVDRAYKEVQPE